VRHAALLLCALAAALSTSCGPTCTAASLRAGIDALPDGSPAATARYLAGQCKLPEPLAAWAANPESAPPAEAWAAACPAGAPIPGPLSDRPLIAGRAAAFEACGAEALGLGPVQAFTAASGLPALAIAVARELSARPEVPPADAAELARRLLGPPAFEVPTGVALPRLPIEHLLPAAPPVARLDAGGFTFGERVVAAEALRVAPPHGPTGHAIAALPTIQGAIAVDAATPIGLLHRVAASVAHEGTVEILAMATVDGADDRPHPLRLVVPTEHPMIGVHAAPGGFVVRVGDAVLPPLAGCPNPGPTACTALGDPLEPAIAAAIGAGDGPIGLDLGPDLPAQRWLLAAARIAEKLRLPTFDPSFAPCVGAPAGMVCVPGGFSRVGDRDAAPGDGPTLISASTFYLDANEATVADYAACVAARGCTAAKLTGAPTAAAAGLTHVQAEMYCAYRGKRLPTEWEWERAARLDQIDLDCDYARTRACPPATVSSAGRLGAHDLFGGVSELTSSMPLKPGERCGAACQGRDPLGPCDGAPMCKGRLTRIARGASTASATASPNDRGIVARTKPLPDHGARCVSSRPVLETFPPAWIQSPPDAPPTPAPLTDAQRAALAAIKHDAIDQIPVCDDGRRGSSRTDCKDPTHYIYPNEDRGHITFPYLVNRGGALLGVGSDQNYTFAALARSELMFLLDYDAMVVHIHRINQAFIKASDTPDAFVALWDPANATRAQALIAAEWPTDPKVAAYQRLHRSLGRLMHGHYERTRAPAETGAPSWLRVDAHYAYVRDLWRGGRVVVLEGDMMGPNAMLGAAQACRDLGVPMRVYYTSNAPNAWGGEMTEGYRRNVRAFPMDEHSVVLQALGWTNEFGQTGHWHYNVQRGTDVQERLGKPGYAWLWQVVRPYRPTNDVDLSLSGLPGTWDDARR
jgi:hypothetical protein